MEELENALSDLSVKCDNCQYFNLNIHIRGTSHNSELCGLESNKQSAYYGMQYMQVNKEFEGVLKLLEFNELSYVVFRRWYVDGRLYYHAITDESDPKKGITELRYIDPHKIRKVREVKK